MLSFLLAIPTFLLGIKAFTPGGLPITRKKSMKGGWAKVIGGGCILFALLLCADGYLGTARIIKILAGDSTATEGGPAVLFTPPPEPGPDAMPTLPALSRHDQKPAAWDDALDVPEDACVEALDEHELAGKWEIVSQEIGGEKLKNATGYYEFKGRTMCADENGQKAARYFEIDPRSDPKRIDFRLPILNGRKVCVMRAIYRIEGDTLTISDATPYRARPDRFVDKTTKENDYSLCVLKRVKRD